MTTQTQHTPGPWTRESDMIVEDQARMLLDHIGTAGEWQAVGKTDDEGFAEVIALCHPKNTPLITAAPELLEALKRLIPFAENESESRAACGEDGEVAEIVKEITKARQAIAKAEGK